MPRSQDAIARADLAGRLRDAARMVANETVPLHGLTTTATEPPPARVPEATGAPRWAAAPVSETPAAAPAATTPPAPSRIDPARFTVGSESWQDAVEGLRNASL